jgi:hypothetical protein
MNEKDIKKKQDCPNYYELNAQSITYLNDKEEITPLDNSQSGNIYYNHSKKNYINNSKYENSKNNCENKIFMCKTSYQKICNLNEKKKDDKAINYHDKYFNNFEERKDFIDNLINNTNKNINNSVDVYSKKYVEFQNEIQSTYEANQKKINEKLYSVDKNGHNENFVNNKEASQMQLDANYKSTIFLQNKLENIIIQMNLKAYLI